MRLPLQKQKDPKPTPVNDEPCFSSRLTSKDPKATQARPCFLGHATSEGLRRSSTIEEPCSSGRATFKDTRATSVTQPCFSVRATPSDLRAGAAIEEPCSSGRLTSKDLLPAVENPCFSGHATPKDREAAVTKAVQDSGAPIVRNLDDNSCSQPINSRNRGEVPMEQKFDDSAQRHSSSNRSKSSKRAEKREMQFRHLIVNWRPSPFLLDVDPGTEDLEWLSGSSGRQRPANSDAANSCIVNSTIKDQSRGVGLSSVQPKACYLPEFETYHLPYVVPY